MADVFSREKRSEIMSRIHQPTKLEARLRPEMEELGFEYGVRGFGDFVNHRKRVTVFLMGCFWHAHRGCYREPKSNAEFWRWKVIRNRARDSAQVIRLLMAGYNPLVVWECEADGFAEKVGRFCAQSRPRFPAFSWGELGYIVGYALGDGSVHFRRRGHRTYYRLHLYGKADLLAPIRDLLRARGLSPYLREDRRDAKFGTSADLCVSSRFLHHAVFLSKLDGHLLAFPRVNGEFDRAMLVGFFDADGGWNSWGRKRQARFFSKRRENLEQVGEILGKIHGIQARIYRFAGDKYYLSIYRKDDVGVWEHEVRRIAGALAEGAVRRRRP
ncbi:MAG: hypothetical protein JRE40_07645 [Deltaproteobacteria bacterium]|nr:hypothetical protein [Deltaproteobacteria bacterium]MBW2674023.1 hypothetical protein [Deltaproteobacteria bacterium]